MLQIRAAACAPPGLRPSTELEELRRLGSDSAFDLSYIASPDGSKAAFRDVAANPEALVVAPTNGTGLSVVPGVEKAADPAWRPQ